MFVTSEITIDLDEKRRIWMTASADNVPVEQISGVAAALSESITEKALEAAEAYRPKLITWKREHGEKDPSDLTSFE